MKIVQQGAPEVNATTVVYQSDEVILIEIDMMSKYCRCNSYSGKEFWLCATDESLHLADGHHVDEETMVELDEIPDGFLVFAVQSSRYTISIALKKNLMDEIPADTFN